MRPKKPEVAQHLHLEQARQEQLVLHHAVLDAARLGEAANLQRLLQIGGDRLLAVDVLAGRDRLLKDRRAHLRGRRVEQDLVGGIGDLRVEIGAPAQVAVRRGELRQLGAIAADQHRLQLHPRAVLQRHAAGRPDGSDGPDQVLVHAHASGDAVHDHAETARAHALPAPCSRAVRAGTHAGLPATLPRGAFPHRPARCQLRAQFTNRMVT